MIRKGLSVLQKLYSRGSLSVADPGKNLIGALHSKSGRGGSCGRG